MRKITRIMTISEQIDFALKIQTPFSQGEYENGCHTWQADQLIFVLTSDSRLHSIMEQMFEKCFKAFSYEGEERQVGTYWHKDGLPDTHKYVIVSGGFFILNEISSFLYGRTRSQFLFKSCLEQFNKSTDEQILPSKTIKTDFHNWVLRNFERWLNKNKIRPAKKEDNKFFERVID